MRRPDILLIVTFILVQVALVVLKLCNAIAWNWVLVFMPAILFVSIMIAFIVFCIIIVVTHIDLAD